MSVSIPAPAPSSAGHDAAYVMRPLEVAVLERWRAASDAAEVIAGGGEPVRCCLRDAEVGERLLLVGYSPPLPAPSPYAETGAVYVHADRCGGPRALDRFPLEWEGRPQVLRAYDERGWIHPATRVHRAGSTHEALVEVLGEPGVVEVHTRNVAYGCFMVAVRRPEPFVPDYSI